MPRVLGKLVTLGGQSHAIGSALEQGNTQRFFQLQHRCGDRRLRNVHLERGLRELTSISCGDKVAQLPHGNIFGSGHLFF
ncbi:hypothetical protein D3C85_1560580 [compost metagenome]